MAFDVLLRDNGAGTFDVDLGNTPQVVLAASANIAASAATATTAQLTPPSGKTTGDFTAGKITDDTNPVTVDIGDNDYTEIEVAAKAVAGTEGKTFEFRLVKDGVAFNTYSKTPIVFVQDANTLLESFETIGDWTTGGDAGGSVIEDTTYKKHGVKSFKFTAPDGGGYFVTRSISVNFYTADTFALWVYVPTDTDVTNLYSVAIYLTADGFSNFFLANPANVYHLGWNKIILHKSDFTASGSPSWATTMTTLRVRANANAGGGAAVAYVDKLEYRVKARPKVVVNFDDGWDSQHSQAYSYMNTYGVRGTAYIIGSLIGTTNYMTLSNLTDLYNADWDLGSHGATNLTTLSLSAAQADVEANRDYLSTNGFTRRDAHKHYAYPNGGYNASIVSMLAGIGMISARNIIDRVQATEIDEALNLTRRGIYNTTSLATAEGYIDKLLTTGGALLLNFHRIVTTPTVDTEVSITTFQGIIDYIVAQRDAGLLDVVTITDLVQGGGGLSVTLPLLTTGEQWYTPTLSPQAVTVTLPQLTSAENWFAPTLTAGAVSVTLPLLGTGETWFVPSLTTGAVNVTLPLLGTGEAWFTPTLAPQAVTVTLPLMGSSETWYTPSVAGAGTSITTPLIASAEAWYTPTVAPQPVTVTLPLIASAEQWYTPQQNLNVTLPLLSSAEAWFTPALTTGAVNIAVSLIGSGETWYSPTLTLGAVSITLPLITSAEAWFNPRLNLNVTLSLLASGETWYTPRLDLTLTLALIGSAEQWYAPTLSGGAAGVAVPLIVSGEAWYTPSLTTGAMTVTVALIPTSEQWYTPTISAAASSITLPPIVSIETWYTPTLVRGTVSITVPLIGSGEVWYSPALHSNVTLPLIGSGEAWFNPALTLNLSLPLIGSAETWYAPNVVLTDLFVILPLIVTGETWYTPGVSSNGVDHIIIAEVVPLRIRMIEIEALATIHIHAVDRTRISIVED